MHYLLEEFGQFWWWIQQGGNSNIILVGITAVYVVLTYRLVQTAEATRRMLMREQRAWLLVSLLPDSSAHLADWKPMPNLLEQTYIFPIVKNHGKTMARITNSRAKSLLLPLSQALPTEPEYGGTEWRDDDVNILLPPDAPAQPITVVIGAKEFQTMRETQAVLWLYGYVGYRDVNNLLHETRFCFVYHIPAGFNRYTQGFYASGPEAYNRST